MANLSKEDRHRGLEYANQLAELARSAPDSFAKRETYRTVSTLRRFYGFSREEKQKYIGHLLKQGCSTYEDLVAESKIDRGEVVRVVREMEQAQRVLLTPLFTEKAGRPTVYISLIEAKNGIK